jgi:sugar lactone lactonase YvrE
MKSKLYSLFTASLTFLALSLGMNANAQQTITTIAGGKIGDNGPAIQALLANATSVAADNLGNIYLCDLNHNIVRKVAPTGIITTVAGTGYAGYSGDNVPAISSKLNAPISIKVDRNNNLYIADNGNSRVRKVTTDGIIHTVAGNGVTGFLGDGAAATNAEFDNIFDIAIDTFGSIYISDAGNNRIRKVNPSGIVHTIAGDGGQIFHGNDSLATLASIVPQAIALDDTGNLYVGDANLNVYRINPMDTLHVLYLVPNVIAGIQWHAGILYLSDFYDALVYYGNMNTGTNGVFAGTTFGYSGDGAAATAAQVGGPWGLTIDPTGNIYIADPIYSVIRMVNPAGIISTFAGATPVCCNGIPATDAGLVQPFGVAADVFGNVFIADRGNSVIRKIDHSTGLMTTIAGTGVPGYTGDGAAATAATLDSPTDVKVDPLGNIYIADEKNSVIRMIDPSGTINTIAGNGNPGYSGDGAGATSATLYMPHGIAVDNNFNIYIADMYNHVVRIVDPTGTINTLAGINVAGYTGDGGPATSATMYLPSSVALDPAGNVYIADKGNNVIRKITIADGKINTIVGDHVAGGSGDGGKAAVARLDSPVAIAIDPFNRLYISDETNQRIRIVVDSNIYTMAGNGTIGYYGDGGPAINAEINFPEGIHVDANGNLYIADSRNQRIRYTTHFEAVNYLHNVQNFVEMYPNPNNGMFTVKGNVGSNDNAEVSVLDAVGQSVYNAQIPVTNGAFTHTVNLSDKYASGIYFVRVKSGDKVQTIRFTMDR